MTFDASRREFLKAGLALPAAGLIPPVESAPGRRAPQPAAYRILGKTGLKVSAVGCGAGVTPDPDVLRRAVDLGVNYFDTARGYGNGESERITGAAIKANRSRVVLASKTDARTAADVRRDLDASLKALGTDYLDIWHLHSRDTPDAITDDAVEACLRLKEEGKTRFIGVSTHDVHAVAERILNAGRFDVVQTTYSYAIDAPFRRAAIGRLDDAGIGVVAMKVIIAVAGFVPREIKLPDEGPLAALKWVLLNPAISTMVPYSKNTAELEMNVRAMAESYTPEDEKMLYVRSEHIRPLYCRMCYDCLGKCPHGVPVPDELRFLSYNDFGGDYRKAREHFLRLPAEIRSMRCRDCAACTIECPNGVAVRQRLIRAQELLA